MNKYKLFITFLLFLYSNNIFGSEIIDIEIGVKNNRLINHCQENLSVFVHNSFKTKNIVSTPLINSYFTIIYENISYYIHYMTDYKIDNSEDFKKQDKKLSDLPEGVLQEFATYLDPISVVSLSHVSHNFKVCFNNTYWNLYNLNHKYNNFEESYYFLFWSYHKPTFPLKITLANYYYEIGIEKQDEGLIRQSSILGLSQAKKHLQKKEEKTSSYTSYTTSGYDYDNYHDFCRSCGAPRRHCRCGRF